MLQLKVSSIGLDHEHLAMSISGPGVSANKIKSTHFLEIKKGNALLPMALNEWENHCQQQQTPRTVIFCSFFLYSFLVSIANSLNFWFLSCPRYSFLKRPFFTSPGYICILFLVALLLSYSSLITGLSYSFSFLHSFSFVTLLSSLL
jgi:hypothetical protein